MRLPPDPTWPARLREFVSAWRLRHPTQPVTVAHQPGGENWVRLAPGDPLPEAAFFDAWCFALSDPDGAYGGTDLAEMLRDIEFHALPMQAQIDAPWAMLAEGRKIR